MTDDEIDLLILKHGAMDQWPTQKQCHEFAAAIRNAVLEEAASECDGQLLHGSGEFGEGVHACVEVIRAMKTKEGG